LKVLDSTQISIIHANCRILERENIVKMRLLTQNVQNSTVKLVFLLNFIQNDGDMNFCILSHYMFHSHRLIPCLGFCFQLCRSQTMPWTPWEHAMDWTFIGILFAVVDT